MPFLQSLQKTGYGIFANSSRRQMVYVGGASANMGGTANDLTISLTNLSGGANTAPQAGDIVVIAHCWSSTTNRVMAPVTAGYTVHLDRYSDSTYDTNLGLYTKIMGSTPDTSVIIPNTVSTSDSAAIAIQVWRNVDKDTPLDIPVSVATGTGTLQPTFLAIPLSANQNSVAILFSAGAGTFTSAYTNGPTGTSNFISNWGNDTNDSVIGMASYLPAAGEQRSFTSFGGAYTANANQSFVYGILTLRASF